METNKFITPATLLVGENFTILSSSVQGATHIEKGLVCQDAIISCEHFYRGESVILTAVSDGHGSSKYKYSDLGAHFAIKACCNIGIEFGKWIIGNSPKESEKQREFKRGFIRKVLQNWHSLIEEDFKTNQRESNNNSIATLYGCTLSFAIICKNEVFAGQIGDGAILHYQEKQHSVVSVMTTEKNNIGLSTDSLCSDNAIYKYNFNIFKLTPKTKGILLLTTDGLIDSLENDVNVALEDIYVKTQKYGIEKIREIWSQQLFKWSDKGVGDDMGTILIFYGNKNTNKIPEKVEKNDNDSDFQKNNKILSQKEENTNPLISKNKMKENNENT